MPDIPHLKKKIGNSYLIWFQNTNNYTHLEEPAWFVFMKTIKRYKMETIANQFSSRYDISYYESLVFVKEIQTRMEYMNTPETNEESIGYSDGLTDFKNTHAFVHHYKLGNKVISFSYETSYFENYLHPLIAHLETDENHPGMSHFELYEQNGKVIFRFNMKIKGSWTFDESHLVKGSIFMHFVNVMYDMNDEDWLMTVHASAISNGQKTILFSAAPGNGKTTIAVLLQAKGYQLISDDFVPVDRQKFCAWPFPIAMSVKQGSINLLSSIYPDLEQKPLTQISPEKSVRYLSPENIQEFSKVAFPVKEFIFVKYDQSVDFEWEKLEVVKALKLLLDQSWISPAKESASILLNQLTQWSFYQLTYSNNSKALGSITNLFDHD